MESILDFIFVTVYQEIYINQVDLEDISSRDQRVDDYTGFSTIMAFSLL